jgi:diguanylate cyclase (GGDEF)-like protein
VSSKFGSDLMETWRIVPRRPKAEVVCNAILVHIYPPGPILGTRYLLNGTALIIGRGNDCDIRIADSSVSRHHARIELDCDTYALSDLGSTNRTFINDVSSATCKLKDGDYLRIGNCIYRFLAGNNVEAAYHEEIYKRTIIDALTDVHNKRYLLEYLDRELARSARFHRPISLVMFDIDHFKWINDELGHLAGDYTLRELAACVKSVIRREEEFARYGGDEFAVVLPETAREHALMFAERIRGLVSTRRFQYTGRDFPVTVSMGLAVTTGEKPLTSTDLIRLADENLYQAKREGRNRVVG